MELPIFALLAAVVTVTSGFKTHPFVQTSTGAISGTRITVLEKEIHRYYGIPYATPPVGDLRFKSPLPVIPWNGLYEATNKPTPCMQYSTLQIPLLPKNDEVSEDCLYLNLWVPNREEAKPLLPIMVWIHGGGFTFGESGMDLYSGGVLAAYGNVIVASMNYRLGIFGFLNAEVEEASGNMGLLDQVLALKWIKTNAKRFGGDPDQITIFGESAGSMSVGLHLLSPLSQGLFNRAIMQSGAPYHPNWGGESSCSGPVRGDKVARAVGCSNEKQSLSSHPHEVVNCLKSKDALLLSEAESTVFEGFLHFLPRFGDDFLPRSPIATLRDGNFNLTKVLTGITSNEGVMFILFKGFIKGRFTLEGVKWTLEYAKEIIEEFCSEMGISNKQEVLDYYLGDIRANDDRSIAQAMFDVQSHDTIVCPEIYFLDHFSADNTVYFYVMDHHPSISLTKPWTKMSHFDDVQFVFGVPLVRENVYTKEEVEFSRSVMDIWINFAKTGNPKGPEDKQWPKYTPENRNYLEIKTRDQTVLQAHDIEKRCQFWHKRFVKSVGLD